MVFPVESEDKTLRNLLMLCQDDARLVVEAYRKTLVTFDFLTKGKFMASTDQLAEIHKVMDESARIKVTLYKELNEIGGVLVSRDDFLRLASAFSGIMDTVEALAVRLIEVKTRNWKLTKSQAEGLGQMSDLGFDALIKLRDSIMSLGFNSEKAASFSKEIDEIEKKLDVLYIQVDLDIITSGGDLPTMLILRDIAREIEKLGDKSHEASDLVRILSL